MNCFTLKISEQGPVVTYGISRSLRRTPDGPQAWLGYPFVTRAPEGCQNEGRHCDFLDIEPALLAQPLPENGGDAVLHISRCGVEQQPGRIARLTACSAEEDRVLILVQTDKPEVDCQASSAQIAEGFLIEHAYHRPSRHPSRYVKRRVDERLIVLQEGNAFTFTVSEPEIRVMGYVANRGCKRTFHITTDGDRIKVTEIAVEPLPVSPFDSDSLVHEAIGGLLLIGFGIFCGTIATMPGASMLLWGIAGGTIALIFFLLVQAFRLRSARNSEPKYCYPSPSARNRPTH